MGKVMIDVRRYELKYTITEEIAAQIKEYIRNICTLDKHVPPGKSGYIVNNLYFDTADLKFYHDTKHRKLTRYKPRARYYGEKATDFIWPEIKYRNSSIIWKKRYSVPIEEWPLLFQSKISSSNKPLIKQRLDSFDELIYWHNAHSVLHVRYYREPYVTELEEYGRVTFDRQLCCRPTRGSIDLDYNEQDMLYYDDPVTTRDGDSPVLLEIKVETLVPEWAIDLIRTFDLLQRPFSKYCYGLDSMLNYNDNGRIALLTDAD
ncbi:polyphosphate polymerase domain-containing protein [candidate division KSB1 bacterium]|nr:polyphosphate polymerase domain-containing protein [candidate division KSB1 bacterium]